MIYKCKNRKQRIATAWRKMRQIWVTMENMAFLVSEADYLKNRATEMCGPIGNRFWLCMAPYIKAEREAKKHDNHLKFFQDFYK